MKKFIICFFIFFNSSLVGSISGECQIYFDEIKADYKDNLFSKYIFKENIIQKLRDISIFRSWRDTWTEAVITLKGHSFKYLYLEDDLSFVGDVFQSVSFRAVQDLEVHRAKFKQQNITRYEDYERSAEKINLLIKQYEEFNSDLDKIFSQAVILRYNIELIEKLDPKTTYPVHLKIVTYDSTLKEFDSTNLLYEEKDLRNQLKAWKKELKTKELGEGEFDLEGRHILQFKMKEQLKIHQEYAEDVLRKNPLKRLSDEEFKALEGKIPESNLVALEESYYKVEEILSNKELEVNKTVQYYMNHREWYKEIYYLMQNEVRKHSEKVVKTMEEYAFGINNKKFLPRYTVDGKATIWNFIKKIENKGKKVAAFAASVGGTIGLIRFYISPADKNVQECLESHLDRSSKSPKYKFSERDYILCKERALVEEFSSQEYEIYTAKTYESSSKEDPAVKKILDTLDSIQKLEEIWEETMLARENIEASWSKAATEYNAER